MKGVAGWSRGEPGWRRTRPLRWRVAGRFGN
uniref:Uncharacterized protein n=1 Tax=Arundo donax TaxID=35708 RepID=A0A0A9AQQ3_ARUDO